MTDHAWKYNAWFLIFHLGGGLVSKCGGNENEYKGDIAWSWMASNYFTFWFKTGGGKFKTIYNFINIDLLSQKNLSNQLPSKQHIKGATHALPKNKIKKKKNLPENSIVLHIAFQMLYLSASYILLIKRWHLRICQCNWWKEEIGWKSKTKSSRMLEVDKPDRWNRTNPSF